jgi:hypothetical protein
MRFKFKGWHRKNVASNDLTYLLLFLRSRNSFSFHDQDGRAVRDEVGQVRVARLLQLIVQGQGVLHSLRHLVLGPCGLSPSLGLSLGLGWRAPDAAL